ncbi:MAG TPA: hypothetical protein VGX68_04685 [Thermoanaerobaculia bacterium]|jgi:hypothetical protein|nr:hypothetical protein [Thermoanaerobaculia bacterium]
MSPGRSDRAVHLVLSALIAATLLGGALFPAAPRAFQAIVFAAMLAALWGTGSRLCRWLVGDWEPLSRRIAAFTFAVGVAVVPATWMGHFGVLRPGPFLMWTAAAFLLSLLLPESNAAAGTGPAPTKDTSRSERIETALLIAAALAIGLILLREVKGMRYLPPGSYDDLSYHLSAVATWIRHGDLRMIRFSMGDTSTPYYPILGEMSSWVLFAPFRDSDVAARWTQLPFACFSILAAAAIARRLGLGRRDAALAAVAYAGIYHVFPFLAMGAGNDHSLSFFTLAAVDGSLAFARRPRAGEAVATGTALGLLLATKYIAVLFAPVLVALLLLALLVDRRRREETETAGAGSLAGLATLLVAVMLATGGYTYLRNAVTAGNPIFPAPVRVLGVELFPGWVNLLERDTSPEYQIDVWHFLTRRTRLFGHYFPFTLLPAALLAPLLALARRRWREALVFTLPAVFFLQFRFLIHDHRDIRYFLPGIALAAVAFAWLLARIGPRIFPFRAAILVWIVWQEVRLFHRPNVWKLLVTLALLGIGALLEIAWRKWRARPWAPNLRSWSERWGPVAAAALVAIAALPAGWMIGKYQAVKLGREPAPLALERLAGPDGARVAYAGLNKPYLFFGSRLQNQLEIVPRSRALAARTYRWGSGMAEPYAMGPYRRWRGNLERLGIEFVVLIRTPWSDPEGSWLTHRAKDFQLAYRDAETEIWRVLPSEKATRKRGGASRPVHRRRGPGAGSRPGAGNGSNSS